MSQSTGYTIPKTTHQVSIEVNHSRFIATAGSAATVDEAKAFIEGVRQQMPDASHHVYAFRVGFGNTVTEGMSDDGEPSGTSGPPALAILRGAEIGDIVVVITRYFGGQKLGKGGLVRAYGDAVRDVLDGLPTELKVDWLPLTATFPYTYYEPLKKIALAHDARILSEEFLAEVNILMEIPAWQRASLDETVREATLGSVQFEPPRSSSS